MRSGKKYSLRTTEYRIKTVIHYLNTCCLTQYKCKGGMPDAGGLLLCHRKHSIFLAKHFKYKLDSEFSGYQSREVVSYLTCQRTTKHP